MEDNFMEKSYIKMLGWLGVTDNKKFAEACEIKEMLTILCIKGNKDKITSFIINKTDEIDNIFGDHTAEQLLQFAP